MNNILDVNRRELPSFTQWIQENSPGTQADGFEAFADLVARSHQNSGLNPGLTPQERVFSRMWLGYCIASVEICNMEAVKHQTPHAQIVATLPRVIAAAAMYAIASACDEATPWRDVAKAITEEFRAAAKVAADQLTEQFTGGAS